MMSTRSRLVLYFFMSIVLFPTTFCWANKDLDHQLEITAFGMHNQQERILEDGATLFSGDNFKFIFRCPKHLFVYPIMRDSSGGIVKLITNDHGVGIPVRKNKKQYAPLHSKHWYELDSNTGIKTIYIFSSPKRLDTRKIPTKLEILTHEQLVSHYRRSGVEIQLFHINHSAPEMTVE